MGRGDKNPSLQGTCIVCRSKVSVNLHIKSNEDSSSSSWRLKALFIESFCMAFGLPSNHPFLTLFINKTCVRARLCFRCFEDVGKIHHIFWQFQSLEKKLLELQNEFFHRMRSNYDAMPTMTLFSSLGVQDLANKLERLKYDEVVKIMFETIKDIKDAWPKLLHSSRWKDAVENAEKLGEEMQHVNPVSLIDPKQKEVNPKLETIKQDAQAHPLEEDHDYLNVTSGSRPRPKRAASANVELLQKADAEMENVAEDDWDMTSDDFGRDDENKLKSKSVRSRKVSVSRKVKKGGRNKKTPEGESKMMRFLCIEDPEICSRTYKSRKHLKTHIRVFHNARKFVCDFQGCSARYDTEQKLEAHKAKIHEKKVEPTESCGTCGIQLPRKDMKRHYYLRHVGIGKFSCEVCSMDFNDEEEFKMHEKRHKESVFPFSCVVCEKLFTNSLDLRGHVSSNHLSSGLKCEVCGIMKPNDFLLRRHMKCHEKVRSFVCSECGKSFTSRAYLNYHMEHTHENAGKRYPCEICGKTFSHLKNVLRHKVTHQDNKPFKCKICHKTFNYSHLLKKHEEIHSNTKNYGCEVCGKRFRQEQNLTQHMRSHRPKSPKLKIKVEKEPQSIKPSAQKTSKISANRKPTKRLPGIPIRKPAIDLDDMLEIKIDSVTGATQTTAQEDKEEEPEIEIKTESISSISPSSSISGQLIIPQSQSQSVHQIQLTLPSQQQQQGTTTVVFLTGDQNFHWIT